MVCPAPRPDMRLHHIRGTGVHLTSELIHGPFQLPVVLNDLLHVPAGFIPLGMGALQQRVKAGNLGLGLLVLLV